MKKFVELQKLISRRLAMAYPIHLERRLLFTSHSNKKEFAITIFDKEARQCLGWVKIRLNDV